MKKIGENVTTREIENLFLDNEDKNLGLFLKKSHEYEPIELVTIIHFLLSHLQTRGSLELHTNIATEDADVIQRQFYDYYILVCCILFNRNVTVRNRNGHILYTEDLYSKFISKLKSQDELYVRELTSNHIRDLKQRFFSKSDRVKNDEGLTFLIPCFDHLNDVGLEKSAYFHNPIRPKGPRDISVWFERLFQFNNLVISLPQFFYDLSIVINELVQNTHDWARTTYDDREYIKPNIRACAVNIFLEHKLSFKNSSYDHIHEYIKQISEADKKDIYSPDRQIKFDFTNEKVGICEISIFDTGPGMSSRWLHKDISQISNEDEVASVIQCFHKYFTSDSTSRMQLRGRGLSNVIGIIGFNGLLRVRTGRVLIQRNFFKEKINNEELSKGTITFDLEQNDLPLIKGTTISVLYPFVYTNTVKE